MVITGGTLCHAGAKISESEKMEDGKAGISKDMPQMGKPYTALYTEFHIVKDATLTTHAYDHKNKGSRMDLSILA